MLLFWNNFDMTYTVAQLSFRRFRSEDYEVVRDMHVRSFSQLAIHHYNQDEIAGHERMFRRSEYVTALQESNLILAVAENDIVGSAGWCAVDSTAARVRKVFVDPRCANRGLGNLLLGQVENEIRSYGRGKITLCASLNAVPFYQRSAYRQMEQDTMDLEEGLKVRVIVMQKDLIIGTTCAI